MSRVSEALDEGDMEEDNSEEEGFSDDDEMSANEGPDASMTLVQYQTEARRDALIRKRMHVVDSSQKKSRLEIGDLGPGSSLSSHLT